MSTAGNPEREPTSLYLLKSLKKRIDKIAVEERRSRSTTVEMLLEEALDARNAEAEGVTT